MLVLCFVECSNGSNDPSVTFPSCIPFGLRRRGLLVVDCRYVPSSVRELHQDYFAGPSMVKFDEKAEILMHAKSWRQRSHFSRGTWPPLWNKQSSREEAP